MIPSRSRSPLAPRFRTVILSMGAAVTAFTAGPGALAQTPQVGLIRDTEIEETLRKDADPIFRAAGLEPKNIKIMIVGDKELNAFVSGGQQMFLNSGLIAKAKTPSELQGVMAHETGHIAGGHLARSNETSKGALATYAVTMGLGILAAIGGRGDVGASLLSSSGYFATLTMLGYNRAQEAAADQAAATYLDKAGISGKGLVDFFQNFRYQEVFSDARRVPYFQSHPLSGDRIDALANVVSRKPTYDKPDAPEAVAAHAIMVAKVRGFMNYPQQTALDYPETDTTFPARYARAIAAYKGEETEKALRLIEALITEQPNNPYLWELKGQVLFEHGKIKESEAPHRRSVELKPDAPLLRLNLGQAMIAQEDNAKLDESIALVKRALDLEADMPQAWRLLALAYERKNEPGLARLASAEQNFAMGQAYPARDFAERAMELLPKDTPQWRRANDIIQVVNSTDPEMRERRRAGLRVQFN